MIKKLQEAARRLLNLSDNAIDIAISANALKEVRNDEE
jgi:hypothetical protein